MLIYKPSSPSFISWQTELKMLRAAIRHDPTNALAWWWRVRVKVLAYLVSRYGERGNRIFPHPECDAPKSNQPLEIAFLSYDVKQFHSVAYKRRRLQEIVRINRAIKH